MSQGILKPLPLRWMKHPVRVSEEFPYVPPQGAQLTMVARASPVPPVPRTA
jgi:hypothetical protein